MSETSGMQPLPGRRTIDPDAKRGAIVAAAMSLFASDGYERTTIAGIARQAGVAVGTVYRFFPDKAALLVAIHREMEARVAGSLRRHWDRALTLRERFVSMFTALFAEMEATAHLYPLLQPMKETMTSAHGPSASPVVTEIGQLMNEAMAAGEFRRFDAAIVAPMAHGMVEAALRLCFAPPAGKPIPAADAIDALAEMLCRFCAADRARAPRTGTAR